MPATITSYTTFSAGTKARATQVNTNFSNYRGTLLPINEDTTTASDNTHDLGSSDHRWADTYIGGNAYMYNSTSYIEYTGSSFNFYRGGSITGSFGPKGHTSSGAGLLEIALSDGVSSAAFQATITAVPLTGTTLTVNATGTRPIKLELTPWIDLYPAVRAGYWAHQSGTSIYISLLRDGSTINSLFFTRSGATTDITHSPAEWKFYDFSAAAGSNQYHLELGGAGGTGWSRIALGNVKLMAYEIY